MKARRAVFILFTALLACSKHGPESSAEREISVDEIPKEIRIPVALWDQIEGKGGGEHHDEAAAEGGGGGHGGGGAAPSEDDTSASGALFMPVDVILTEKNPGVLTDPSIRIHLPRGGGSIDFASLTTGRDGSFFVRFEWPDIDDQKTLQSWFVSKARARRLGGEIWGSGCGRYFRINKALDAAMHDEGLKVNTTRNRHLTVLGGHFIFASKKNGQLFLTQVTFKDSRQGALYCEEL